MSKSDDYISAGLLTVNPNNADEVIWTIQTRITRDKIDSGGFELTAAYNGWTPSHSVSAPEYCVERVKDFIRQQNLAAVSAMLDQQKQQQLAAIAARF